ncbi:MAG: hypothetical protein K6T65_04445 [Peptococcaceae bacterium]|nr:hypothetical protein [Peptococcaceae bacterium]
MGKEAIKQPSLNLSGGVGHMVNKIKGWVERFLEEPFYRAELIRAEILKENRPTDIIGILAAALSHNFETMKSWSK